MIPTWMATDSDSPVMSEASKGKSRTNNATLQSAEPASATGELSGKWLR